MFIGSDSIRLYTGFHELNNFIVSIKPIQAFELKLSDIEFDCTVVIWESWIQILYRVSRAKHNQVALSQHEVFQV